MRFAFTDDQLAFRDAVVAEHATAHVNLLFNNAGTITKSGVKFIVTATDPLPAGYVNGAPNGLWYTAPEAIRECYTLALRHGVQVHTHTNGDEATELAPASSVTCAPRQMTSGRLRDASALAAQPATRHVEAFSGSLAQAMRGTPFALLMVAFFFGNLCSQTMHVHQVAYLVDQGVTAIVAASVVGVVGQTPVFGIPGYPVSAIIVFEQLVRPLLSGLLAQPEEARETVTVEPTRKMASKLGIEEFVRAKIRGNIVLPPDIKGNPEAIFEVVHRPEEGRELLGELLALVDFDLLDRGEGQTNSGEAFLLLGTHRRFHRLGEAGFQLGHGKC